MESKKLERPSNRRVHLANERTFLAWIRTSIAIIALGFVVQRFSLFLRELSSALGSAGDSIPPSHGYSSIFGIVLVGLGIILAGLSFLRYRRVSRQINTNSYQPSLRLESLVTLTILIIGIFLIAFLVYTR